MHRSLSAFHLIDVMAENWVKRDAYLKESDRERLENPDWFCSNQMVGAVCYVDLFAGDLSGIRKKLPFFKELAFDAAFQMSGRQQ